jgi:hypothetical protein
MISLTEKPQEQEQSTEDPLVHVVCLCNIDLALCSTQVEDEFVVDFPVEDECVVCNEILESTGGYCPRCGADLYQDIEMN